MSQAELLDDYTKASFPLEVKWGDNGRVRLYAAFGDRVVGVSYYTYERGGETTESFGQVLDWSGQGRFGSVDGPSYRDMDLPPPPAKLAESIAVFEREAEAIQARLGANPDAPEAWRATDERTLASLRRRITDLTSRHPVLAEQAAA